jgi:hypothetical protein
MGFFSLEAYGPADASGLDMDLISHDYSDSELICGFNIHSAMLKGLHTFISQTLKSFAKILPR